MDHEKVEAQNCERVSRCAFLGNCLFSTCIEIGSRLPERQIVHCSGIYGDQRLCLSTPFVNFLELLSWFGVEAAQQVIDRDARNPNAWHLLGQAYELGEATELAEEAFSRLKRTTQSTQCVSSGRAV